MSFDIFKSQIYFQFYFNIYIIAFITDVKGLV
jgi:hypothetical protein